MNVANVGSVYEDQGMYKFIAYVEGKSKGYESKERKKALKARARLINILQDNGFKIHQPS